MTKSEYNELMKLLEFPITLASNYYSDNAESEEEVTVDTEDTEEKQDRRPRRREIK